MRKYMENIKIKKKKTSKLDRNDDIFRTYFIFFLCAERFYKIILKIQ